MRLKLSLGMVTLVAVMLTVTVASASQLTGVGVQSKGKTTTFNIQANGAFTHTEYRPADNLLLVDLSGVSAAKMDNLSRELHGNPGVESYRVVGYKGANGTETTRVELTLASNAAVSVGDSKNAVLVHVTASQDASVSKPAMAPIAKTEAKPLKTNTETASAHIPASAKTVHIRSVSVSRGKDGLIVNIAASGPVDAKVMKLTSPDRIVVDVANALPAQHKHDIAVHSGDVKTVRISRFQLDPPATRIVVDLDKAQEFELTHSANGAVLKLHGNTQAVIANAKPAALLPSPKSAAPIPVDTSVTAHDSVMVEPTVTTRPASAVEQSQYQAPAQPEAVMQTLLSSQRAAEAAAHFSTPALEIPASNASASLRPEMLNTAMAQTQSGIQGATSTLVASSSSGCASGKFTGEPISVNLKEVDLRDFFRLIHEISGLNVVLDPKVSGTLTIVLDDVPWDQALSIVMKNNGLDCQLDGNVLRIATTATIKKEADDRRAQTEAQALAVDLLTITRYLNYAVAKDIVPTLKNFLSPRGSVIADDRTNSLVISDIPGTLPNVDRLIHELDKKTQEVEIEARVVAATRNFARDIGTQLGFGWKNASTQVSGADPNHSPLVGAATAGGAGILPFFSNLAAGPGPTTNLGFSNAGQAYRLDFILTAAESRGLVKILSRPRIVTQNNVQAIVKQGQRIPIVTAAQLGGPPTVQYVDAYLRLTVRPQITAEGTIFLNVDVENTVPDFSRTTGSQPNPVLQTQQATTQVLVTDGGTVVIGGVIQTNSSVSITQVPLLGSIPIVGNLFKRRSVQTTTQELIFFLTPKIIQT